MAEFETDFSEDLKPAEFVIYAANAVEFSKKSLEKMTTSDWLAFSKKCALQEEKKFKDRLTELRGKTIAVDAVNLMCLTMADLKSEELIKAKQETVESILNSIRSFCESDLPEVAPHKDGLQKALEIIRRSV